MQDFKKKRILIIEDNSQDSETIVKTFKDLNEYYECTVVENGKEAIMYLNNEGKYQNCPKPDLIITDINMPIKDGKYVLRTIKNQENLKSVPIVVLTSSDFAEDVNDCYNLHANCYFKKPSKLKDYYKTISLIEDYWFKNVVLPMH